MWGNQFGNVLMCIEILCYCHFIFLPHNKFTSRKILTEMLTHLVPPRVHFMDETFMTEIVKDAVTHLIITGM